VSACVKITLETDPLLVRGFLRGWCSGLSRPERERRVLWPDFAPDEAAAVQSLFANLPAGVQISADYSPQVTSKPDGKRGMYAPEHGYACRGQGQVSGDLRGVLEVHERCRQYERVRIEEVVLHLGGSPQGGN
jgi:hypothetical protein